jgi:2-enoate reductase
MGKEYELGGALRAAGAPKFKADTRRYMEYLKKQVLKHNITVRYNKEATVEEILKHNPDVVIVAAGTKPIIPNIPGIEGENVVEATNLLANNIETGEKVVVLGGGLVGCETALMLEQEGKDVTIVEMLDDLLLTAVHAPNCDQILKDMVAASNIKVMTSTTLLSIDKDKVLVKVNDEEKEIPCDTLVVSVGYKSDKSLTEALETKIKKVFEIGDYEQPGKIINAVHKGFHTIRLLEDL